MKKLRPFTKITDIRNEISINYFPPVTFHEIIINCPIEEECEKNNGNPVFQEDIIKNTTFKRKILFESLSRLSKIGVIKKIGSGKKNSRYINLKNFYED